MAGASPSTRAATSASTRSRNRRATARGSTFIEQRALATGHLDLAYPARHLRRQLPRQYPALRARAGRPHASLRAQWRLRRDRRQLRRARRIASTPSGETDSEMAFCLLLDRLAPLWKGAAAPAAQATARRRDRLRRRDAAARHRQLPLQRRRVRLRPRPSPHPGRRLVAPPGLWFRHRHRAGWRRTRACGIRRHDS